MDQKPHARDAFSLIELMIVVTIIGILASISVPAFNKYKLRSRMTEASIIMKNIVDLQKNYHVENNTFLSTDVSIPTECDATGGAQPASHTGDDTAFDTSNWSILGAPTSVDTLLYFHYKTDAGKTDALGNWLGTGGADITDLSNNLGAYSCSEVNGNDDHCEEGAASMLTFNDLGITASQGYDFVVISAGANFSDEPETECTILYQLLEKSEGGNYSTSSIVRVNFGE